jgi:hypothetical protein
VSYTPETQEQYAQRVGPPRVVKCHIDLGWNGLNRPVWYCITHEYGFNDRPVMLSWSDRCPMSRLEEWRARKWEATA